MLELQQNYQRYVNFVNRLKQELILLQCSVPEWDLHCQCILSIYQASVHQFYANILVLVNIDPFLYTNDQYALVYVYQQVTRSSIQSLELDQWHLRSNYFCQNTYNMLCGEITVLLKLQSSSHLERGKLPEICWIKQSGVSTTL